MCTFLSIEGTLDIWIIFLNYMVYCLCFYNINVYIHILLHVSSAIIDITQFAYEQRRKFELQFRKSNMVNDKNPLGRSIVCDLHVLDNCN